MRFGRLTNAFSKKVENHAAAIALYFMYYNFGRVHQTLPVTPAIEAGVADHVWSIEEIVALWARIRPAQTMKEVRLMRLAWVWPLSVATAVLAVLAIQAVAIRALAPLPRFSQAVLSSTEPAILTAVLVSAAVAVFALCVRWAVDPLRKYRQIAIAALLVSFLPNVAAGFLMRPAVDWPSMMALMVMHVAAWAVTVSMLTRLTTVEGR